MEHLTGTAGQCFWFWLEPPFVILNSVFNFRALMSKCEWPFPVSRKAEESKHSQMTGTPQAALNLERGGQLRSQDDY